MGGRLFDRTSRTVRLTPIGQAFFSEIEPICKQLQRVLEQTREKASGVTGWVRIGTYSRGLLHGLREVIDVFEVRHCHATYVDTGLEAGLPRLAAGGRRGPRRRLAPRQLAGAHRRPDRAAIRKGPPGSSRSPACRARHGHDRGPGELAGHRCSGAQPGDDGHFHSARDPIRPSAAPGGWPELGRDADACRHLRAGTPHRPRVSRLLLRPTGGGSAVLRPASVRGSAGVAER